MGFLALHEWTTLNVFIRIFVSLILGGIIGLDRGSRRQAAGIKTNTVVCLGSTLVMLTAQYIYVNFPGSSDVTRMAAQVISGIGFLGVGTIIISGHQVRGLTTAASLWTCSCIGLAVGIGFISGAVIICILMLLSIHILPRLERYVYRYSKYVTFLIELEDNKAISQILHYMKQNNIRIESFDVLKSNMKGKAATIVTTLYLRNQKKHDRYLQELSDITGVSSVDDFDY